MQPRIMEYKLWWERRGGGGVGSLTNADDSPGRNDNGKVNGNGSILVFISNAMMFVDPVLAQGFTIAMESGASVV